MRIDALITKETYKVFFLLLGIWLGGEGAALHSKLNYTAPLSDANPFFLTQKFREREEIFAVIAAQYRVIYRK